MRLGAVVLGALAAPAPPIAAQSPTADPPIAAFFDIASPNPERADAARETLTAHWRNGYAAMLIDELDLMARTGIVNPQAWLQLSRLVDFLQQVTGQSFGHDFDRWRQWVSRLPYEPHPGYGEFKQRLYAKLDPDFAQFFRGDTTPAIRLDGIQWGGVAVNGIPPLDHPAHVAAAAASYLADDNIVFGVFVDGTARAYPKRILAWHELALDKLGGRELTIVYCTLCGTVIPFDSVVGGKLRKFGTSGFLYESNKLMFDAATSTLWSSITGEPVVGPLVGKGLRLDALPVVTTTWGEWRRRHPDTTVLSIPIGYARDYSEGAAYRAYFATDALMFDVSKHDPRLPNKAEVLVLRPAGEKNEAPQPPVAISADFLRERPVFHVDVGARKLVVITDATGANRVYESGGRRFERLDADGRAIDSDGRAWLVREDALEAASDAAARLPRVPAHRSFWFGWYAQNPSTRLIK